MEEQHRLFHGSSERGEIDLPVIARRRRMVTAAGANNDPVSGGFQIPRSKEQIDKEKVRCHWCQLAKFSTHARFPVTITNHVDSETIPVYFQFIEHSILGADVEAADDAFKIGCECENDLGCELKGCHCLQDMDLRGDPGPRTKVYAYASKDGSKDCLRPDILETRDPIYECHEKCECSKNCNNRVVERGRKIPLDIFRTSDGRGWGVRSPVNIKRGQYVDNYMGEIITSSEADWRRQISDIAQRKDVYLFALDKFYDEDSIDPRLAGPPLEVDGEFKSGPTRFINHSCEPNLRSFARVGDHADKHLHDLALFAIRDIPAGKELTFDYVDGEDGDMMEDLNNQRQRSYMQKCRCGSVRCRGHLW